MKLLHWLNDNVSVHICILVIVAAVFLVPGKRPKPQPQLTTNQLGFKAFMEESDKNPGRFLARQTVIVTDTNTDKFYVLMKEPGDPEASLIEITPVAKPVK